jgi:hypothetical protein
VPTLEEIQQAMATQIEAEIQGTASPRIEDLQVTHLMNIDPTPPSIDIYPADPSQEALTFGKANNERSVTVRARVSTSDHQGGQSLLLTLMDPSALTSVAKAITSDRTLGGKVSGLGVSGPSGFGLYADAGGQGSLMGCVWTVRMML